MKMNSRSALALSSLCALLVLMVASAAQAEKWYTVTNLRELAGPDGNGIIKPFVGYDINDHGQVVGYGYTSNYPEDNTWCGRPFFYDPATGHIVNLGDMDGNVDAFTGGSGNAYGIDNDGWVTGRNGDNIAKYNYHSFLWKDVNANGVTDPGEMRDLGVTPGYDTSEGWSMNNVGQVIGTDGRVSPASYTHYVWTDLDGDHAYDVGERTEYPSIWPVTLNDNGDGAMNSSAGDIYRWIDANNDDVADPAELTVIPNQAGGTDQSAKGMNSSGQVMGTMRNAWDASRGFLWTDTNEDNVADSSEIELFGSIFANTFPRSMNNAGQIVGGTYTYGSDRHAFLWDSENGMVDLNNMIDYSVDGMGELTLSQAEGINELGQIVVTGEFSSITHFKQKNFTFVLTPLPGGDATRDGGVDVGDLGILAGNWGTDDGSATWDQGDFTGDGNVDVGDLGVLAGNWGTDPVGVPEPTSLVLLGGALAGLIRRKR
jgi:probable HAF family extracellular repeat protein